MLQILNAMDVLADFPNIGRPGRLWSTRELVVLGSPFVVIYRARANSVQILRVLHGARRWPPGG